MISPRAQAIGATAFFSAVGIASWFFAVHDKAASLPLAIFYAALMVNTYYSVRLFSAIIPEGNARQHGIDAVLVVLYIALALAMGDAALFIVIDILFFIAAVIKYSFLLKVIAQPQLLRRKIRINALGVFGGVVALGGIFIGYPLLSAWILSVSFCIANILLLFVWPMYRADDAH